MGTARPGRGGGSCRRRATCRGRASSGWRRRRGHPGTTWRLASRRDPGRWSSRRGCRSAVSRVDRTFGSDFGEARGSRVPTSCSVSGCAVENRRVDARAELRIAHELFVEIGMEAFADRARSELQATGEHVRARAPEARDDLTPRRSARSRRWRVMGCRIPRSEPGCSSAPGRCRVAPAPRVRQARIEPAAIRRRAAEIGARVRARMSLRGRASECATLETLFAIRRGRAGRWFCGGSRDWEDGAARVSGRVGVGLSF